MESMTGYGRGSAQKDGREIVVELKAVNHRFLDVSIRAPKSVSFLEEVIRARLQQNGVKRGHVDVSVVYQNRREDAKTITVDRQALGALNDALRRDQKLLKDYRRLSVAEMLTLSGALMVEQKDEDSAAVTELALLATDEATAALLTMRRREGEALANDLLKNLDELSALRASIAARAPLVPEEYRKRLTARLEEWQLAQTDPQRVAQEVAMMADRCAIDEELSRLLSHIAQFGDAARQSGESGKKLDFLLQEMNRETNTIGSKASDTEIAQAVVAAKCLIEKLREQVQNVV